ncbi:membrane protein insertase YidC [bacterium]|nr:membrane protein insertase YidC [bacterium]
MKRSVIMFLMLFVFVFAIAETAIENVASDVFPTFENDKVRITFDPNGGKIIEYLLKGYESSEGGEHYNLLPPLAATYPAEIEGSGIKDINQLLYDVEETDRGMKFSSKVGDISISKEYIFQPGTYFLEVELTLSNDGDEEYETDEVQIQWGPKIWSPGLSKTMGKRYSGAVVYAEDKVKNKALGKKLGLAYTDFHWMGYNSLYFAVVFFNSPEITKGEIFKSRSGDFWVSAAYDARSILPQESTSFTLKTYIGPKSTAVLKDHGGELNKLVSMGLFGFLTKLIIFLLKTIYGVIPNYGLAIIIITLMIKLLLFPLSTASIKSMKKMSKIQPELKKLQAQYKDDPKKLNEETMKLYKIFKVNPMGGCLPVLVQLPFFWAIYSAFSVSIELRGANFIFWIKDLARPDTIATIFGMPINILPILMGVAMYLQQEIQGTQHSQSDSAKYMKFLPFVFLIFFWNMPSALVLYWLTNNILSIIQTLVIYRQNEK